MADPLLYEINTRCWLQDLSRKHAQPITLLTVPDIEFQDWRRLGFTHIWAMGVWTSGSRAREIAISHPDLRRVYDEILPGWIRSDVGPSPYAISDYRVPPELGGDAGLAEFRRKLHEYGSKLILDFVPNHVGVDHPWLDSHPEYFVQRGLSVPETFERPSPAGPRWFAHGKDPGMPSWTDTVQVDYRVPEARQAMADVLQSVAARCDGVRCDMAMLVLSDVFQRTWQNFPLPALSSPPEFWEVEIAAIKKAHPEFLFLAEVYWNLEQRLQSLGFDFTYDKTLYDRVVARDSVGIQKHLLGLPPEVSARCAHFLENHDERRIASLLSPAEERAAALLILTLPGMRFLHEGQLTGSRVRAPVQLLTRPAEPARPEIATIYEQLLKVLPQTCVGQGRGEVLTPREATPGNFTGQDFILIQWTAADPPFYLIAINLAPHRSQCVAPIRLPFRSPQWSITSLLDSAAQPARRDGAELETCGYPLDLEASAGVLLRFDPK